jgi:hypothetical protein
MKKRFEKLRSTAQGQPGKEGATPLSSPWLEMKILSSFALHLNYCSLSPRDLRSFSSRSQHQEILPLPSERVAEINFPPPSGETSNAGCSFLNLFILLYSPCSPDFSLRYVLPCVDLFCRFLVANVDLLTFEKFSVLSFIFLSASQPLCLAGVEFRRID